MLNVPVFGVFAFGWLIKGRALNTVGVFLGVHFLLSIWIDPGTA